MASTASNLDLPPEHGPATPSDSPDLRLLAEALPDPFFTLDRDWRFTSLNSRASEFLGRPAVELIGKLLWEEFPATLGTPLETETRHAMRERRLTEYEDYYAPLARWVEVRAFPIGEGLGVHYRDVSARKQEEAQAGLLARHASDLITVHAADGHLTYRSLSPSVRTVLGFRAEELVGRSAHELIHPDDLRGTVPEPVPHQPGAMRRTYRIRRGDGSYIWVETTSNELRDARGEVSEILAISRDVSERRRAEEHRAALAEVTVRLAGTHTRQEAVAVMLAVAVPAVGAYRGAISLLNAEGQTLEVQGEVGYEPALLERFSRLALDTAMPITDALRSGHPIYVWRSTIAEIYPQGEALLSEPTGSLAALPLARSGAPGPEGQMGALALSFREERPFDAPERAFLEAVARECALTLERADLTQAGREEQDRYRVLASVTNDALWNWELAGDTIAWNDGVYTLFGYQPGEVPPSGAWWRGHIHPDDRERVLRGVDETYGGAGDWRDEYRFQRRDGSYATVLDRGQVIRDDQGEVVRMIGGMTDLSDRERHRQEVQRLNASLEARVVQRTEELRRRNQRLQTETDALSTFAGFTQAVGSESDPARLARLAVETLLDTFGEGSAVYYERIQDTWKATVWGGDLSEETVRLAREGFAVEALTPGLAGHPEPRFVETWDGGSDDEIRGRTSEYGKAAMYPVCRDGEARGLLTVGMKGTQYWNERDRAVFGAVGHGLTLAAERAHLTGRLLAQTEELRARTAALEGFAELARDLAFETDPHALVRRAQEIVLSMLPRGVAFYYEPRGELWRVLAQTGSVQNETLQAAIDGGLPFEDTGNLMWPWRSGEPYYQDAYAPDTDNLATETEHIGSTAAIPIFAHGQPTGVLAVALFGRHRWTATDRAVLNTAAQHLTLALERAGVAGALAEQRAQLQEANEGLEAFSYSVSHDLRAPVRHIQGFAGILRQALSQGDAGRAGYALKVIDDSSVRMNTLIDELLRFARLSRQGLSKRDVDLAALVNEAKDEVLLGQDAARVIWEIGALPTVQGDPALLRQVLLNLLDNALKYSGGRPGPRIEIGARQQDGEHLIWVRDNGVGFDPQYADRLFGVFQRLHRADEFEGTGIGLATVRRIVQRHGGQVWAEARPGEGATFSFSLPRT
ncbi:PAS domain S-box protein [Deinococcus sp.]|uniref:PAS domain S-box protein n=1 Tax=Deinococcus sp. TaxID=47478 RepID=UPI003C7D5A49